MGLKLLMMNVDFSVVQKLICCLINSYSSIGRIYRHELLILKIIHGYSDIETLIDTERVKSCKVVLLYDRNDINTFLVKQHIDFVVRVGGHGQHENDTAESAHLGRQLAHTLVKLHVERLAELIKVEQTLSKFATSLT